MNPKLEITMKFDPIELSHIEAAAGAGRLDLYADIHKALRAWMSHVLLRLGQIDTGDEEECAEVAGELEHLLSALQAHLTTENTHVHPAIEARRPGALAKIEQDHRAHEQAIAKLSRLAQAMLAADPKTRDAAALFLYRSYALFVAENLEHMHNEETLNNQLLWSAYDDSELLTIHQAILASTPPEKMAAIAAWMIPAITPAARTHILCGIQATAPAPAFLGMLNIAQSRLSVRDWSKLSQSMGLPVTQAVDLSRW